jgi:hypothetical protein
MNEGTGWQGDAGFTGIFAGMPRIESPAFAQELDRYGFDDNERDIAVRLHRDGFVVIDFEDPDLDARIARIKANLSPRFGVDLADPESDKTLGERRLQDAWNFDPDVRAIATNAKVVELLGKLYGRRAFPFQTLNFPVGTQQDTHSDSVHFSSVPERFMCGVWLAMEDVPAAAGPLFYLRGSHRWPIVSNAMIGRRGTGIELSSAQEPYGAAWDALARSYGAEPEPFLARKGQALIWCANLMHGGSPQIDPRLTRWSQVTHYYFENCTYYTPAFSDEVLGQLHLRSITGIDDGRRHPNTYLGQAWPEPAKPRGPRWLRRMRKRT